MSATCHDSVFHVLSLQQHRKHQKLDTKLPFCTAFGVGINVSTALGLTVGWRPSREGLAVLRAQEEGYSELHK